MKINFDITSKALDTRASGSIEVTADEICKLDDQTRKDIVWIVTSLSSNRMHDEILNGIESNALKAAGAIFRIADRVKAFKRSFTKNQASDEAREQHSYEYRNKLNIYK